MKQTNVEELTERVERLSGMEPTKDKDSRIEWSTSYQLRKGKRVNGSRIIRQSDVDAAKRVHYALQASPESERIDLMTDLVTAWCYADANETTELFGPAHKSIRGNSFIMGTVAEGLDGKGQLRLWYGSTARMTSQHVDSCGSGLLLDAMDLDRKVENALFGKKGPFFEFTHLKGTEYQQGGNRVYIPMTGMARYKLDQAKRQ